MLTRLRGFHPVLATIALLAAGTPSDASVFYDFTVVAATGMNDSSGSPYSSFLPQSASINDQGNVSFVGTNAVGQSVYVGDGGAAAAIVSFNPPSSTRFYSSGTQINNDNQVIARDRLGSTNLIRIWDGDRQDPFLTIVRGSISGGTPTFPAAYSAVFSPNTV